MLWGQWLGQSWGTAGSRRGRGGAELGRAGQKWGRTGAELGRVGQSWGTAGQSWAEMAEKAELGKAQVLEPSSG